MNDSSTITLITEHEVEPQQTHCGHFIYLQSGLKRKLLQSHEVFYCTICGSPQFWKAESEMDRKDMKIDELESELDDARKEISDLSPKPDKKWFQRR